MKSLIVLPSYNESGNIVQLIEEILKLNPNYCVCVVDDNSPDGTADLVKAYHEQMGSEQGRLQLIVRAKKDGRGGAVRDGFLWGLSQGDRFDYFVEMDCDFSHDPKYLDQGLSCFKEPGTDFVIGARYPSGQIIGWPLKRKILSACSNFLTRVLINWQFHDYTNGYRFYSRKATEFLCQQPQNYRGYIYLSESLAFLIKAGFKGQNFPIVFVNRQVGKSNTTFQEVFTAFRAIFKIAWIYRVKKWNPSV